MWKPFTFFSGLKYWLLVLVILAIAVPSVGQQVYVDEEGVLRNAESGDEVAFFGVNYSPPFAHSYRAINELGKDHKQVIDQDAYHFARLGFDGFRIHVWDTEISDSLGHVVSNEHLDLLDYMLAKFKQRGIKVVLTPLTFYDNGYPEPPTKTDGFANYISKGDAPEKSKHWLVIKRYLKEFINHKNPYTGLTYKEDPNILALEIVNEPAHGGDQDSLTSYVNMLADHLRNWEKPIFYNISQNPSMAQGVMNADIDGTSFQWYPGGLVGGEAIEKNYLPYISEYSIPFADEEAFDTKAQMVYEFSAADFMGSYALPAMARSFRAAGFQWATQFAYDPMVMAPYNTDYRTHYLNMAYTPAKAISMKIASAAFHQLPRGKSYGPYPQNNTFGSFKVSHKKNLSILNADTVFFYTNDTEIEPQNPSTLKHVAGVGSSRVVSYRGTGAYFLDKVQPGVWRLEVMPDAVHAKDPFAVVSLDKRLTWIEWNSHPIDISLNDLGDQYRVLGINEENELKARADDGQFNVSPGTYLLTASDVNTAQLTQDKRMGNYRLNEYVAPEAAPNEPVVRHEPSEVINAGSSHRISAKVAGLQASESVKLVVQSGWQPQEITMKKTAPYRYEAEIPAKQIGIGFLSYWIVIDGEKGVRTFPGDFEGHPGDWDYFWENNYRSKVVDADSPILLFEATEDLSEISYAFQFWNSNSSMSTISTDSPGGMAVKVSMPAQQEMDKQALGWKSYVGDRIKQRGAAISRSDHLVVEVKGIQPAQTLKAIVVDRRGRSYSATVNISDSFEPHKISFETFEPDSMMLLPRPYPTFLPLWFKASDNSKLRPANIEEIQFFLMPGERSGDMDLGFAVESAWIDQSTN
jgi:hypothetical protein